MTSTDRDRLAALLELEQELQLDHLDHDIAWDLGSVVLGIARSRGLGVVVAVHGNGQRLFQASLAGTTADNDDWIDRKARTALRFGHSSLYLGSLVRLVGDSSVDGSADTAVEEIRGLDPALYATHGGSFPLIVRGTGMEGTLTVSGLPQLDDHHLAVEGLRTYLTGSC